ncbi:MAG: type II secretion system F family protein [Actinobacteria bacterium]|nr:type II secretion system F family protein [Actinomycetota bacterium]MBL7060917.1 type II secretion system F family protein [Actinomycetota bacterium]
MSKEDKKYSVVNKIGIWLNKNNLNLDVKEFLILIFILFSLTFLIGLFFRPGLILSILFSIINIFLFFIFINIRKKRENIKKENQLEQFLLDLVGYLYGNPNILNCVQKTIEDTDYPLRKEFELVLNDTRKGLLLNEALRNMIRRNSSPLIEIVLIGFIAANDKGVDLIGFLKDQIEYIREKKNIERYIRILSSGPKYTSYLITLIPIVSIIIIILINRDIIEILLTEIGVLTLIYIILSNIIGFFIINKVINYYGGNRVIK